MTPTGIAIIGTGYWGPGIVRNLDRLDAAEVLHLVDRDEERALATAEQLAPNAHAHGDLQRALQDEQVEAVVIATPIRSHYELARQALKACKHVLVEKPLAMTVAECRELEALAAERSLVLMVGHIFLFNGAVQAVKSYLDSGELGQVLYVHSRRVNLGRVQGDVNALWSFAPHDFSILDYWLGAQPIAVQARGFAYIQNEVEDVVFCTVEYPNGVGAHLHLGWLDPRKVREMTVVGSEKMVVFDDTSSDRKVQLYDSRVETRGTGPEDFAGWQVDVRHGDVTIPQLEWTEPLRSEMTHFLDCIRNGTPCRSSADSGTAVTAAIVAAQLSLLRDGSRVTLEEVLDG
ncbi:MAG: Gfo/Idh/MocA family oxidoreductase [Myxococcota bacterium]|nr:Gfo/Idh/MocA family oxidoreductase [Myxococcota bacterium]